MTGGAGYVGSHCCKLFSELGWKVVVYDNLSRGWRDLVKWGELIEGDILDLDALTSAIKTTAPDIVAHFAAFAYVAESMSKPGMYYRNNVQGTLNLLEAMKANSVSQLIFSSTCATYGISDEVLTEASNQSPINPYGSSKLMAERLIRDFCEFHGFRSVILRYFNAGGCDPDLETGERHDPEPHVIPLAIKGAKDGDFTFTINGNDFDTRDGTCIRDYVHVCDLARAHGLAAQHLSEGKPSEIINLSTGGGTSILELVDAVSKVSGVNLPVKYGPRRPGDPPSLVASNQKAKDVLGWAPGMSDIETIVRTAWAWFEQDKIGAAP